MEPTIVFPGDAPAQQQSQELNKDITIVEGNEYILDTNGNALDKDGKIFKTKEELNANTPPTNDNPPVEETEKVIANIEGVDYNIDDAGNAVDETGNIKFTKEELESFEEDTTSEEDANKVDIKTIKSKVNIPILNEQGEEVEYEDSAEGISKYVSDLFKYSKDKHSNDKVDELKQRYPILEPLLNHLELNNGSLDGFNNVTDYSKIVLSKDDEPQLTNLVIEERLAKGDTKEQAIRYASYLKDDGKLLEGAKDAQAYLANSQKASLREQQAKLDQQRVQAEIEEQKYWGVKVVDGKVIPLKSEENSVYNKIVDKGKISINGKDYNIPENIKVNNNGRLEIYTRKQMFDYLYIPKPTNIDGEIQYVTGYDYDKYQKNKTRSIDDDIYDALLTFVKQDNSQFIEEQIDDKKVKRVITYKHKSSVGTVDNKSGATPKSDVKIVWGK